MPNNEGVKADKVLEINPNHQIFNSLKETFENDKDSRKFWDTEISSGRTKRSNIELLLQSYFSIKTEGEDFKVYELFQEYKKYLDTNMIMQDRTKKEDFISDLIAYSKLYREYVNPDNLDSMDRMRK